MAYNLKFCNRLGFLGFMTRLFALMIIFLAQAAGQNLNGILLLGDSNTAVNYLPENEKWSSLLSDSLGLPVFNKGVGGSAINHALEPSYMQTWKSLNAEYVIMYYGLNNGGDPQFENYQRQLINEVLSTGATPILMTNLKVDYQGGHYSWNRNNDILENDNIKRALANELDIHIIDIYYVFEDSINNGNWDHRIRNKNNCPNNDNFSPHANHNVQQNILNNSQDTYPNHISMGAVWFTNIHYNFNGCKIVAKEITKYFRENIFEQTNDISLNLKVFLEGPFNQNSMSLSLNSNGFIPLEQPYNNSVFNYDGTESVTSVPENVVDWILIELRDSVSASSVRGRRACFVTSNGNVVDLDGTSLPEFNLPSGNYYVVVRHRNHLPVMSATEVFLSNSSQLYDFSIGNNMAYGNNPLVELAPGIYGMPAGDGSGNGIINVLDYGKVANQISTNGYKT